MAALDPRSEAVLNALETSPELQTYFFGKADGVKWLQPLIQRGYFDANRNPAPVVDEKRGTVSIFNWAVLDYLERVAQQTAQENDENSARLIRQILRDVTNPTDKERVDNYRTWWKFAKILSELPPTVIEPFDIDMLVVWLGTRYDTGLIAHEVSHRLLPRLLKSDGPAQHRKAEQVLDIATRFRSKDEYRRRDDDGKLQTVIDAYHLGELFKKNAEVLGRLCGPATVRLLSSRLPECLLAEGDDRYTYVWRGAVEDNKQQNYDRHNTRGVFISALRDVLLSFTVAAPKDAQACLAEALESPFYTFKRIALHVIGQHYALVGDVFWSRVDAAMLCLALRHELYVLVKQNFGVFTPEQRAKLLDLVTQLSVDWENPNDQKALDASMRMDWLHAMKGQGDDNVDRVYADYLALVGSEPKHPEFASYMEAGWVGQKSPITAQALALKDVPQIVSYLTAFQPTGKWREPSEEGLGETLKEVVKQQPSKFEDSLQKFLTVPLDYQYYLLRAFLEIWDSKKHVAWPNILEFCRSLVFRDGFWEEDDTTGGPLKPTRSWVTACISDLIKSGTRSDEHAFDLESVPIAQEVLTHILKHQPSSATGRDEDALTEALNTSKGSAIEALFNLALRRCRVAGSSSNHAIWTEMKPIFDAELEKCTDANFEFSALAGNYLPNLFFLSADWVSANIDGIFSTKYERNWACAMQGFAYVNAFYDPIYTLLLQHGHLRKVVLQDIKGRHVREKVLQQVAIAYLRGTEPLPPQSGLFTEILERWNREDIMELIGFFWMLREGNIGEEATGKILDLWRWCYAKLRDQEEDNAEVLSKLTVLAVFLTNIGDEEEKWLLQAAPWAESDYNAPFLIEYLDRLADANPAAVARVYEKILTRCTPSFDPEHIRSILTKLYGAGLHKEAGAICNTYGSRGMLDLVRDIYEAHRQSFKAS